MTELKQKICLIVSSKMTLNSFLLEPIKLLSQQYEIFAILKEDATPLQSEIANKVTVLNVEIERKINLWADIKALFQIFKILSKYRFSLVHSVTPKAGLLGMLAGFICRVPVRIHTFTGQVWATKRGIARCSLKNIDRLIAWLTTDALVDSPSQKQFLLDEQVLTDSGSLVLAEGSISGVDITRFRPDEGARQKKRNLLNYADEDVVFLFLGRLNRDKGILDLAEAFAILGNPYAKLLIVGPDEARLTSEIQSLTQHKSNSVQFVEFAEQPEEYMAAADVLCLPSYREGFGNVIIEAAAVGIPAIGTRIYGLTDAIEDRYSGLIYEPRNVTELQNCMNVMLNDEVLRKRLGLQARSRVVERFSSEVLAQAWLSYYQDKI